MAAFHNGLVAVGDTDHLQHHPAGDGIVAAVAAAALEQGERTGGVFAEPGFGGGAQRLAVGTQARVVDAVGAGSVDVAAGDADGALVVPGAPSGLGLLQGGVPPLGPLVGGQHAHIGPPHGAVEPVLDGLGHRFGRELPRRVGFPCGEPFPFRGDELGIVAGLIRLRLAGQLAERVDRRGALVFAARHPLGGVEHRRSSALRSGLDTLLCLFQYAKSKDIALEVEKQRDAAKHADIPLDFLPIFETAGEGRQLGLIPIQGVPRWKKAEGTAQAATEGSAEGGPMPTAPSRTEQKARRICARIAQILNGPDAPADGYVHFDAIYEAFAKETARGFGKTAIGEDLAQLVKQKLVLQRKGKRFYTLPPAKEPKGAEGPAQKPGPKETPED